MATLVSCGIPLKEFAEGDYNRRGLYSVDHQIAWASGSDGAVLRLTPEGWWWKKSALDEVEEKFKGLDFRDVHGFSELEALIMSSGDGCKIFRTKDGGQTWQEVYENLEKGIFFDGMDFWDDKRGIAFSDPIDGRIYLIHTLDGGRSWKQLIPTEMPLVQEGEAGFAASGTGIVCKGDSIVWIATGGGEKARVFKSTDAGKNWKVYDTPIKTDPKKYRGIYSMAMKDELNGVVIGGSFTDSAATDGICATTQDGGLNWKLSENMPTGYRSCLSYLEENTYICCGRNGIDISFDGGVKWERLSQAAFYSVIRVGETIWFTGKKGKMGSLSMKYVRRLTHR